MFNPGQNSNLNRATTERGVLACEKCSAPIYVNNPGSVSIEFCVPCTHCGHRGIYFKRMLTLETIPERRGNRRG
jgi:DNA-directed RNA polymerase subunit RPC12/RpoP